MRNTRKLAINNSLNIGQKYVFTCFIHSFKKLDIANNKTRGISTNFSVQYSFIFNIVIDECYSMQAHKGHNYDTLNDCRCLARIRHKSLLHSWMWTLLSGAENGFLNLGLYGMQTQLSVHTHALFDAVGLCVHLCIVRREIDKIIGTYCSNSRYNCRSTEGVGNEGVHVEPFSPLLVCCRGEAKNLQWNGAPSWRISERVEQVDDLLVSTVDSRRRRHFRIGLDGCRG